MSDVYNFNRTGGNRFATAGPHPPPLRSSDGDRTLHPCTTYHGPDDAFRHAQRLLGTRR